MIAARGGPSPNGTLRHDTEIAERSSRIETFNVRYLAVTHLPHIGGTIFRLQTTVEHGVVVAIRFDLPAQQNLQVHRAGICGLRIYIISFFAQFPSKLVKSADPIATD
jgi:hypothetical protein